VIITDKTDITFIGDSSSNIKSDILFSSNLEFNLVFINLFIKLNIAMPKLNNSKIAKGNP
jgi:hypothetical protein